MSVITKRGDAGETDMMFGSRAAKTSLRVAALGAVDELNAALGVARVAGLKVGAEWVDELQAKLVGLMGVLATMPQDAEKYAEKGYSTITVEDVRWLEEHSFSIEKKGVKFTGWARPGEAGAVAAAALDMARTIARRAELEVWRLHESGEEVPEVARLFMNRVSDFLWLLARVDEGKSE